MAPLPSTVYLSLYYEEKSVKDFLAAEAVTFNYKLIIESKDEVAEEILSTSPSKESSMSYKPYKPMNYIEPEYPLRISLGSLAVTQLTSLYEPSILPIVTANSINITKNAIKKPTVIIKYSLTLPL